MKRLIEEIRKNASKLSSTEKKLLPVLDRNGALYPGVNQEACNFIKGILLAKEARKPSEIYKVHLSGLVDVCVLPALQEEFYYALDEMNQFQATSGPYRRSVRGKSYTPFVEAGVQLLWAYARLKFYQVSLADVLSGAAPKEIAEDVRDETCRYAGMLAAQIDRGNDQTIQAVKDLLLGESNTLMITYELLRGIVMSKEESLYQALGDFLLAARLQEGVRQAVCETMDAGRTEAFLYLFQVIEDNDLIRYSSVKRALSTWIGIYDFKSMERMADKMIKLMGACLRDPLFLEQQLSKEDAVGICCALWAKAFYDVKEASDTILRLAKSGTKHQMMTASYYLGSFQSQKLSMEAAKKILFAYPEDLELAACYLPYFMGDVYERLGEIVEYNSSGCSRYWYSPSYDKGHSPRQITPEKLSLSVDEAKHAYALFKEIFEKLPKKGLVLDPCIFPWYRVSVSRSDVAIRMCLLAWALQEELYLDEAANLLPSISDGRHLAARVLLYRPKTKVRRMILLDCLHSQETNTRNVAFTLVKRLSLSPEDYKKIEGNMKYKKGRKETLDLLKRQEPEALRGCIERLLKEKSEECHMGGLELAQYLKEKKLSQYRLVVPALEAYEHPTKKEQILLTELIGEREKAPDMLHTPGYGLYRPDRVWELPRVQVDVSEAERLFVYGEKACIRILERLDAWIDAHKDAEYVDYMGEEQLLGVELTYRRNQGGNREDYPLMELWDQFYKEEIKEPQLLMEVYLYEVCLFGRAAYGKHMKLYADVFGKGDKKEPPFKNMVSRGSYPTQVGSVINLLFQKYVPKEMKIRWGLAGIAKLYAVQQKPWRTKGAKLPLFDNLVRWLSLADGEAFTDAFVLLFELRQDYQQISCLNAMGEQTAVEVLGLSGFVQCYVRGIWDKELFYKAAFTFYDIGRILRVVTAVIKSYLGPVKGGIAAWDICMFFGGQPSDRLTSDDAALEVQFAFEIYEDLIPKVLDVELRRGEEPTPFSEHMANICVVLGIPVLLRLLHAIGDDTLDRSAYYYGNGADRRKVLSSLLSRCYPRKEETVEDLTQALKGSGITKKRLIELAMYAPQWIPLVEAYLKIPGFQSGCYYFMAHTSEWLDDGTMAMVAKYTPLTREELQDGAFDIHWFREAYGQLGEKEFKALYQAAKYTSYGTAHARAKKYADAALGNTDFETLKAKINEKRNKDLLMSLPLLPFDSDPEKKEEELMARYQYILQYRKESRQFGAQRRASEARTADMALQNLSMSAGFSDVTRLTLHMETQLTESYDPYFTWQQAGEMRICICVDETGKCSLQCEIDGKIRKSVPAKYKKDPLVTECQAAVKKLKEQYTRTRRMLEESMEDGIPFEIWELQAFLKNPVLRPLTEPLVYVTEESEKGEGKMGFLSEDGLTDWSGQIFAVTPKTQVRIAHPWDLYRDGHWQDYQNVLFEKQIRQPFKQVFRELYVKLTEELNKRESRLFSGYQIQPKKTVATLRTRRWVADYESGLQKVYYKENLVAVIYALADWFSPSDIEAPTLESVIFYDRKDFSQKKISDIPDRIYSEVMRDVDLAVSTAYVGGVDPESSHSTVEMRRVIVEGNLKLFGVKNVRLERNHAVIDGQLGQYTVHLGSGVVHQTGNAMLYILPVHSQHRGKLFLPFVDEDPKTAEVWSKILLLAEDKKIKDPAILAQIR